MIVDLNPLPFTKAIYIIKWCHARGIDRYKCEELIEAMKRKGGPDDETEWVLNIPNKYMTWFELEDL